MAPPAHRIVVRHILIATPGRLLDHANQKTIDLLLKNKNLRICCESKTSSYSYVPNKTNNKEVYPIPEKHISEIEIKEYLNGDPKGFGELSYPITFGRKIIPEDIPNLEIGYMNISVFQDVTDWFIRIVNELDIKHLLDEIDYQEETLDTPVCMHELNFFMSNCMEYFDGHNIGDGGIGADDAINIGYTIDCDFGITSDDMMTDDMDWRSESRLFFYNKP
jgi:hypothetical protein